ncbi:hypothetical protein L0Y34_02105 [Candidatus Parcubacteria bacterium]|nr:hypothetical protein [Candidatus Parcubacteria bacterium]
MTITSVVSYGFYQLLLPAVFVLSFITFLWGALLFVIAGSADFELSSKGKSLMLYALIVFLLMAVVWGVSGMFGNNLGLLVGGAVG